MAVLPLKASHNEQPSVICFPWEKEFSANAIEFEMRPMYSDKFYETSNTFGVKLKFACGRESIVDEQQPGPMLFRQLMQRSQESVFSCGLTGL